MPSRQAPAMPSPNPAAATHPPTDIHAGDHAPGDIQFLFHMAGNLRASLALADQHRQEGQHPDVASLADDIASTHGAQLVQVDALKARFANPTAGASTTSTTTAGGQGHGGAPGAATSTGAAGGGSSGGRSASRAASAPAKPYGDVTYADPGYQKDGVKRYPLDSADHVKAAWSYINMAKNAGQYSAGQLAAIKDRITAAAKKLGIEISDQSNSHPASAGEVERSVAFEGVPSSDGLTLSGYAAVFDSPTRIRDWEGEFDEQVAPGAFRATLARRMPVLMFEHGRHPLIGSMPLGLIERAEEDTRGLYIEARLSDNWLIEPVRDAVRDGAVTGMSFRFTIPDGGDRWLERRNDVDLRTVLAADVRELGPVVFPAYEPTTAQVRAALDCIDCTTGRPGARSAGGGDSLRARPGNGGARVPPALQTRHRDLRMRGILRA